MNPTAPHVALATAEGAWTQDEDAPVLVPALESLGVSVTPAVWNDPLVDWSGFDLVVVRSTWDYTDHRDEFIVWAEHVESVTRLRNPAAVLRWNTDKSYLGELADTGLSVVPTTYLRAGHDAGTDPFEALRAGADLVVKPTVSAGSRDTARYSAEQRDLAVAHIDRLLSAGRDVMLQPYLNSVDDDGETGMMFIGGEFSHAFRKGPLLLNGPAAVDGMFAQEQIDPRMPTASELALAERTMAEVGRLTGVDDMLYARVDVLLADDDEPALLEVELTEPSWFLDQSPGAASSAATAVLRAARA